jgi:hypothetical protein
VTDSAQPRRRSPALVAFAVILFAEAGLLITATVYLLVELFIATPSSLASALALLVITAIAAIWLTVIAVNSLRGKSWVRAAALTWQALQIAIAIGCFQGVFAQPLIGWLLLVPAVIAGILALSKPVVEATRRDPAAS